MPAAPEISLDNVPGSTVKLPEGTDYLQHMMLLDKNQGHHRLITILEMHQTAVPSLQDLSPPIRRTAISAGIALRLPIPKAYMTQVFFQNWKARTTNKPLGSAGR
jgi:hypothetical protein